MVNFLKRIFSLHLATLLFVVLFAQIIELLLLERMYTLFTSGFLQPHSYQSWNERFVFFLLSLWMDLAFFGLLSSLWLFVSKKISIRPLIASYNFAFVALSFLGIWLAVKYKVLSYFNDTLNFLIIQNLGGGSLTEAFSYVANEAVVFGVGIIVLFTIYWIGLWFVSNVKTIEIRNSISFKTSHFIFVVSFLVVTIVLAAFINSNSYLRYGLSKKVSYAIISNVLDEISDIDRDGAGMFLYPKDPQPLNDEIYPAALDKPNNQIDEDGYGGDFSWDRQRPDALRSLPPIAGMHIVLIMLESVRGDVLSQTVKGTVVAPHLNAIAKSGSVIDYAYSHTGYTTSSITALFNRTFSLEADRIRLTDYLEQSGYGLSFISGQDESFGNMAAITGMSDDGRYLFDARTAIEDRVYPSKASGSLRLSEERVFQAFSERSEEVDWHQPQFYYINFQAAHFPYTHPTMPSLLVDKAIPRSQINESNREWLEATYWNAVAVADDGVGKIIDKLKQLGVYDNTLVMIMADHGESLFDDNFLGHGHALNAIQTRIPLIFNKPGINIETAVGQTDMGELLVQLSTNRFSPTIWNDKAKPVLQRVGSLNNPRLLGIVSYGDIRTILDLATRKVFFNDLGLWKDFDEAFENPAVGMRVQQLISLWESSRWEDKIARENR